MSGLWGEDETFYELVIIKYFIRFSSEEFMEIPEKHSLHFFPGTR